MCERTETLPRVICPICQSTDLVMVEGSDQRLKCKHCGYAADRDLFWTRTEE